MARNQRLNEILEYVSQHGSMDVETAVERIGVSAATVRRDFDELAIRQLATRTHGGINAVGKGYQLPIRYRAAKGTEGKTKIAQAAALLVEPNFRIALNGGTTTTELARTIAIDARLAAQDGDVGLTVVTNAVNIATEMVIKPYIKIVVTGGIARPQSYELIGNYAEAVLDGLTLDIAFLGTNAVDTKVGATANHEGEAHIGALMSAVAKRTVILATSDKLEQQSFARMCRPEEIDLILTDKPVAKSVEKRFASAGIELRVCE